MDIQASLEALCSCPGPSGREDAVASQAMELLRPLMDEVKKDRFGNVIGIGADFFSGNRFAGDHNG